MRKLLSLFLIFFNLFSYSQEDFRVISFKLLANDYSAAKFGGNKIEDNNGELTAIIKVVNKRTGFVFDIGSNLRIEKIEQKQNEIWVYVPDGTRKFEIKHPEISTIVRYTIPINIESGKTYELLLKTPEVVNADLLGKGRVKLTIDPPDSKFYFGSLQIANAEEEFEHLGGNHEIKITNDRYVTLDTIIKIIPKQLNEFNFRLNPYWADVSIKTFPPNANVYLNGNIVGKGIVDLKGFSNGVEPGEYLIKAKLDKYYPEENNIVLRAGEKRKIDFNLKPIQGTLKVITDPPYANLYLDNQKIGVTPFEEKRLIGNYNIYLKKSGYIEKTKSIIVKENEVTEVNYSLINYRRAILPLKFAKGTSFFLLSSALIGSAGLQLLANNRMKQYNNATTTEGAINLREDVKLFDKYAIIGYSTAGVFLIPLGIFSRKLKIKKREYGL